MDKTEEERHFRIMEQVLAVQDMGRSARERGISREACPFSAEKDDTIHPEGWQRHFWLRGWDRLDTFDGRLDAWADRHGSPGRLAAHVVKASENISKFVLYLPLGWESARPHLGFAKVYAMMAYWSVKGRVRRAFGVRAS